MSRKLPKDLNLTVLLLREMTSLSQEEVATQAGIPLSRLSKIERGIVEPSFSELEELSAAMGHPASLVREVLNAVRHSRWAQSVCAGDGRGQAGPLSPAQEIEEIVYGFQRLQTSSLLDLIQLAERSLSTRNHRRLAVQLWRYIEPWPAALRVATVRESSLFQVWSLAELLCEESIRVAGNDADQALERAELALAVAENIPGAEGWRWRARAYCTFHVGNAWRVKGELPSARKHCDAAQELWEEGKPCDPGVFDEARVLNIQAALRRAERQLAEALRLYEEALRLPQTRERPYLLLGKSKTLEELSLYEEALTALLVAKESIPVGDLQLRFAASFNHAVFCCHLGRYAEAADLIPEVNRLLGSGLHDLNRLHLIWLEGRIARGCGELEMAISAFQKARNEFASRKIRYDQALVTLELAEVLAEAGQHGQVRKLTRSLLPVFQEQEVHLEALRALRLFCEAVEQEALTAELARCLVQYLYRARHNPDLRFTSS